MRTYLFPILLLSLVFSCKKQTTELAPPWPWIPNTYITTIKTYLKTNLADSDYANLDFTNAILSKQPAGWFLRIAFLQKKIERDFVLLQTDSLGNCNAGKIIHISRDTTVQAVFSGSIVSESFQHTQTKSTVITNGVRLYEEAPVEDDPDDDIVPSCSDCLPEVIVVGYPGAGGSGGGGGISYADYLNLLALAGGGNSLTAGGSAGSSSSAIYSPLIPIGTSTIKPGLSTSADITVSYEISYTSPGINVSTYMACFSSIPDAGANCSVTLYDDLPVNDNPTYVFNATTGATGHCFLQLTKTNGSQSVSQYIGFTASSAAALAGVAAPGKIVDNSDHKYNASLTMTITTAELGTEINAINTLGNSPTYNLLNYNCVSYAVSILNAIRPTDPILPLPLQGVNSGEAYVMPQSLYLALEQLKAQNGPEANNIQLDVVINAGKGHGACN